MSQPEYGYDGRRGGRSGGSLQHEAEHTRPRKHFSAVAYLAILFGTAFLLLLMSYFMQLRQNEEAASDALKQSASAAETLRLIQEENTSLRARAEELEAQVGSLELELEDLKAQNTELDSARRAQDLNLEAMQRQADAMQWFWQIDDYYTRGYRTVARQLIKQFEELGLRESLPAENTTPTNRFSPARRYQELRDALF